MTDMLDYIKSFSKTKKVFFALSIVLFVYELIGAVINISMMILPSYFPGVEEAPLLSDLIVISFIWPSSLGFDAVDFSSLSVSDFFLVLLSAYVVIFPIIFLVYTLHLLKRKIYNKKRIILSLAFQIIHPFIISLIMFIFISALVDL